MPCGKRPLQNRKDSLGTAIGDTPTTETLLQGEKMKRLQSHPLHCRLQALIKNRLNHQVKELQRENADILQHSPTQC